MTFLSTVAAVLAVGAASLGPVTASDAAVTTKVDWQSITTNSLTRTVDNSVIASDCTGSRCTAVGVLGTALDSGVPTVITNRVGSDRATSSRMRGMAVGTLPMDVDCPTARRCVTVGSVHSDTPSDRTWAAVGSANAWRARRTPSPGAGQAYLTGVSCRSAADCVAVGYYFDRKGTTRGLLVQGDGESWSRAMRGQLRGRMLTAVDCTESGACLIAATAGEQGEFWRWVGTSLTEIPGRGTAANRYVDVSCPSESWCAAAGGIAGLSPTLATVSVNRQGAWRWAAKPVRTSRPTGPLNCITCVAESDCLAGASWLTAGGYAHPGIWEWDGRTKRTVRMPGSRVRIGQVSDVACTTERCVGFGQSFLTDDDVRLLNDTYERVS